MLSTVAFFEESLMLSYQEVILFKRRHSYSIEMIIEVYVTSPKAASPDLVLLGMHIKIYTFPYQI